MKTAIMPKSWAHQIARIPVAVVLALWVVWPLLQFAAIKIIAAVKGWGTFWAFSWTELPLDLFIMELPPAIITLAWWIARRKHIG